MLQSPCMSKEEIGLGKISGTEEPTRNQPEDKCLEPDWTRGK